MLVYIFARVMFKVRTRRPSLQASQISYSPSGEAAGFSGVPGQAGKFSKRPVTVQTTGSVRVKIVLY
jgi:hypothetical protein